MIEHFKCETLLSGSVRRVTSFLSFPSDFQSLTNSFNRVVINRALPSLIAILYGQDFSNFTGNVVFFCIYNFYKCKLVNEFFSFPNFH